MDDQPPRCILGLCNVRTFAMFTVVFEFIVSVSIEHLNIGTMINSYRALGGLQFYCKFVTIRVRTGAFLGSTCEYILLMTIIKYVYMHTYIFIYVLHN